MVRLKRWSKVPAMVAEGSRLPPQFLGAESVDARMVALMRSMLAVSALVIFVFDPLPFFGRGCSQQGR